MKRTIIFWLALAALLSGCGQAEDARKALGRQDMRWNAEALGYPYTQQFIEAMDWWGEGYSHDSGAGQRAEWLDLGPIGTGDGVYAVWWNSTPNRIYFNSRAPWDPDLFCYAARHELGHDLGHQHNGDPTSIMYPKPGRC